ncbi:FKBP-type peptidyl-prolyl cis-trans isomerase [Echinicola sp. 20G]|uniref:FKBP-type peptidyl-prolyl cis-trans isomerase n=1 Tax=Echinicola sp. 20G TaxID=2781961 RepID=UPI0019101DD3|nr:FKBP-type peptidyl-prolyl cis-trans isomerase [Echinicola sp. 20G]
MKQYIFGILGLMVIAGMISCEPNNPYDLGPVYDVAGNLEKDSVKIAEYLETAEYDSLYRIHDPSGVVIIVQEEGTGSRPFNGNLVYTNYVGKLTDGSVFDTNIQSVAEENGLHEDGDEYNPFPFYVVSASNSTSSGAIYGFSLGFKRLRSGSKGVIIIPSPYAYRDVDRETIPANSVLVFEVDFLGMD